MAAFGAPVAHEDDPERAVRAALAIRAWSGQPRLDVRIAVNTGDALVTLDARPALGEAMVAGDVVNTAARMQTAAPVNGILVGLSTYRATRHAITYREAPPVPAKGKADAVSAFEAMGAAPRHEGTRPAGDTGTPLVGRDHELEILRSLFERSRRERSAQLVTVAGVPGIGKSRLVAELQRAVGGDSSVVWRHGRCLPYGDGVTLWALGEVVKAEAAIMESDSPADLERKLRSAVSGLRVGCRRGALARGRAERARRARGRWAARRPHRGGGVASVPRGGRAARACRRRSRICTGPTTACSTSSTSWSSGSATSRCFWSRRPGRSSSSGDVRGEAARRTPPPFRSSRSATTRRVSWS